MDVEVPESPLVIKVIREIWSNGGLRSIPIPTLKELGCSVEKSSEIRQGYVVTPVWQGRLNSRVRFCSKK